MRIFSGCLFEQQYSLSNPLLCIAAFVIMYEAAGISADVSDELHTVMCCTSEIGRGYAFSQM